MSSFLVTGGAGFIGSHLAEALVAGGHRVRVLDDFSTGKRENLAGLQGKFELLEGDCADPATAKRAVEGVDYVFHEAAVASVPRSVADPVGTDRANVGGTVAMLAAAADAGVRRFVFAASSAAYGDSTKRPSSEDDVPRPLSPYAAQKLAGEHYCRAFHVSRGLPTVALRYFNVFGPRQDPNGAYAAVIPRFVASALASEDVTIFGDGAQTRDFVSVATVVRANLAACQRDEAVGQVINVASGRSVSLLELVAALERVLRRPIGIRHLDERPGDVRFSEADVTKAGRLLALRADDFEAALALTVGATSSGGPARAG